MPLSLPVENTIDNHNQLLLPQESPQLSSMTKSPKSVFCASFYFFFIAFLPLLSADGYPYDQYHEHRYGTHSNYQQLSHNEMRELVLRQCPQAQADVEYNECNAEVNSDWSSTKDYVKASCCRYHDEVNCLRKSVKRRCRPELLEQLDAMISRKENDLRYGQQCSEYYKYSKCHFPVWATVTLSIGGCLVVLALVASVIYFKCRK